VGAWIGETRTVTREELRIWRSRDLATGEYIPKPGFIPGVGPCDISLSMPEKRTRLAVALAGATALVFMSGSAGAQGVPNGTPSPKHAAAVRLTESISIDGQLDDAGWQKAGSSATSSRRSRCSSRSRTSARSGVHVRRAGAVRGAPDAQQVPLRIPHDVTRRDQYGNSEHIVISLDPFYDRRTAYSFSITAGGVRRDYYHPVTVRTSATRLHLRSGVGSQGAHRLGGLDRGDADSLHPAPDEYPRPPALGAQHQPLDSAAERGRLLGRGSPGPDRVCLAVRHPRGTGLDPPPRGRSSCCRTSRGTRTCGAFRTPTIRSPTRARGSARAGADFKIGLGKGLVLNGR
jgi:hypothetical protein